MAQLVTGRVSDTMRAWYVDEYPVGRSGANYSQAYPTPRPQSGEVLVEVRASSVGPLDYNVLMPAFRDQFPLTFPTVLGFVGAGVVAALGPNTSGRLKAGDDVWMTLSLPHAGTYADYVTVPEELVGAKPQRLSFEEAASLPADGMASMQAMQKADSIVSLNGKTVLILGGSGGAGFIAVQLAKHRHRAARVITTTSAANAAWMRKLGADEVIDYHTENWWDDDVLGNGTIDFIYDTVGQQGSGPRATHKLVAGGLYLTITFAHGGLDPFPPPNVFQAFHGGGQGVALLDELGSLVDAGLLHTHVANTYDLTDLMAAWNESAAGHVNGKLVVTNAQAHHIV